MGLAKIVKKHGIEFMDSKAITFEKQKKSADNYDIGDIYLADLPEVENSQVLHGERLVVILTNSNTDGYPVVQVVPLTSYKNDSGQKKKLFTFDVKVKKKKNPCLKETSIARVKHLRAIPTNRLLKWLGKINREDLSGIQWNSREMIGPVFLSDLI
jgi:mRNA-degrading endonuclease toxin of MazEF toxin-antitoxin module